MTLCKNIITGGTEASLKERYSRNVIIEKIGKEGQKKLLQSKVLVCGAGGLGSTVIANLAGIGIGKIGIVDNDCIELSNFNRQYIHKFNNLGKMKAESAKNWIKEFNPEINAESYLQRLEENNYTETVKHYDLLIDCFDSFQSKFLLNKIAVNTGKILIHGGVSEFSGQVATIVPGKTACLSCILPQEDAFVFKGVLSPAVSLIASIQTTEAVKILLDIGENLENKLLSYDGLNMKFKKINLAKNLRCKICS